jgi:DHA2 family multidrug resistance protein-like MFS transporter
VTAFPLGVGPLFLGGTGELVGAAPPERAGVASARSQTFAELGGALGIAVLGSLASAVYRSAMDRAIPDGISPPAAQQARSTIGGAIAAAAGLPEQQRSAVLEAARTAFTQGLHLTAAVCVALAVGLAIAVAVRLREPAVARSVRGAGQEAAGTSAVAVGG